MVVQILINLDGKTECLVYYIFDLLWYNGHNLMDLPLSTRREILKSILPPSNVIRFSDHVNTNGKDLFELAKNHKIEGIVAKNKFSHYIPGIRTSQWLKIKTVQIKEALVAGLLLDTEKQGSGFSSLIIGTEENNFYKYIGLIEAGISKPDLKTILSTGKATNKSIFLRYLM
jgi:bifunctional non-homologous end joining protein LigD